MVVMDDTTARLDRSRALLAAVEALRPLPGLLSTPDGSDLRETALLHLRLKVIPELEADRRLPVFVAVQGGTNVGKSTLFNVLAGKILSPVVVQASATKHPLMFLHESWRPTLLEAGALGQFQCHELGDPKELLVDSEQTDLLYLRFHGDEALAGVALIDSPDFDSALLTNLAVARRIAALADVTLFVIEYRV